MRDPVDYYMQTLVPMVVDQTAASALTTSIRDFSRSG